MKLYINIGANSGARSLKWRQANAAGQLCWLARRETCEITADGDNETNDVKAKTTCARRLRRARFIDRRKASLAKESCRRRRVKGSDVIGSDGDPLSPPSEPAITHHNNNRAKPRWHGIARYLR